MRGIYRVMICLDLLQGSGCGSERRMGRNNNIMEDLKMSINGIGTMRSPAWYGTKKAEKNTKFETMGFMEAVAEKMAQDVNDFDEKSFSSVGANAPEEVKKAWMDAAKEIGVNGLGMSGNGMLTHLSKMMVQRLENRMNGIGGTNDLLGNTVQSAIRATEQALYNLDHSLSSENLKSIDVQRQHMKEREFYQSFLEKLGVLRSYYD